MIKCSVKFKDGRPQKVYAPNGKPSKLYKNILDFLHTYGKQVDDYVNALLEQGVITDLSEESVAYALWTKTQTKEFREWWDGKLADENGEPILSRHVTLGNFDTFDASKGAFFSDGKLNHIEYTSLDTVIKWKVLPVFLNLGEKPLYMKDYIKRRSEENGLDTFRVELLREKKKDHLLLIDNPSFKKIAKKVIEDDIEFTSIVGWDRGQLEKNVNVYVIFEPSQVKSLYNKGLFSKGTGNIYYQRGVEHYLTNTYGDRNSKIREKYREHAERILDDFPGIRLNSGGFIVSDKFNVHTQQRALEKVLNKLNDRFGIEWHFDYSMDALGRFEDGKVYINPNRATLETAFHEFAHPFLLVLKKENPALYKELVSVAKREKELIERLKPAYGHLSEEDFIDEVIVTMIGRESASRYTRNIIKRFIDWISGLVKNLFGVKGDVLGDVVEEFISSSRDLSKEKGTFYQIDPEDVEFYKTISEQGNTVQKDIAAKLIAVNRAIRLDEQSGKYIAEDGIFYDRVSNILNNIPFYKYEGDIFDENATVRGDAADAIMRAALLGKPIPETILPDDIAKGLYEEFSKIKEDYEGYVLLPQITFYSIYHQVAGTADLIAISPDGEIEILDLKTSKYDFKTSPRRYPGKKKADSYDRHNAQTTAYRALAETMGFSVKGPQKVIPIKWSIDGDAITGFERPKKYIEHYGDQRIYSIFFKEQKQKEGIELLKKIKQILQREMLNAKRANNQRKYTAIKTLYDEISESIDLEGVSHFIDTTYQVFFGSDNFQGYYNIYKHLLEKSSSVEDFHAIMQKLYEIEQMLELYKNSLDEIWASYLRIQGKSALDVIESDSLLGKVEQMRRAISEMETDFKDAIPRVLAKILVKHVPSNLKENVEKRIKDKKEKLGKLKEGSRRYKKLMQEIIQLEERFLNDKGEVDLEESLYREIKLGGYSDVGLVDRLLSPAASMPVGFLSAFTMLVKDAFMRVRLKNITFIEQAYKHFEKFKKASGRLIDLPDKFNEGLYEVRRIGDKEVLSFVAPIDYNAFNAAKEVLDKKLEGVEDSRERLNMISLFNAANLQVRPLKHIEGVTKIGNVVLIETIEDLEKRKKKELGKIGFELWKKRNTNKRGEYKGEYLIPRLDKYKNGAFEKMVSNSALRDYYIFLMDTYLKAQDKMPRRKEEDRFIAPFIDKSTTDRMLEGEFWDTLKYKGKDIFMLMEEDYLKENIERNKTIPILYWNNAYTMNAKDVSKDLIHSVLRFKIAADRYEAKREVLPIADNLLSIVKNTTPIMDDGNGLQVLDKAAKRAGITEGIEKYLKKHDSNVVAMLEAFIDTNIYEIRRKDPKLKIGKWTIDLGKIADSIIRFGSLTQIAFDPLTALANSLNAQVQVAIEAFAGQYVSKESWLKAQKIYNENELHFIQDALSPYNRSFISVLGDSYDFLQGEYEDEFGKKLSKSALKAKMNTSLGYSLMHKGEHRAAHILGIALLLDKKDDDGISLFEKHQKEFEEKGTITPDEGILKRSAALNKRLHGIYNRFDAVEVQRHFIGRLLLMYRKFLVPGFKRRFKIESTDYELGDFTEGFYRTFYRKLFTETSELINALRGKEGNIDPFELYNIRRAVFEHLMIMGTGLLAYVLMKLRPDFDDDDRVARYAWGALLYEVLRVNAELSIYGGVGDINDYFLPDIKEVVSPYKTTTAAYTTLLRVTKVYQYLMQDLTSVITGGDIQRYERDTGIFEKGDSKLMAAIVRLMGISGKNLSEDIALQSLMLTKGVDIKSK